MDVSRNLRSGALQCLYNIKWLYRPSQLCLYVALILVTAYHNGGIQLISMLNLMTQFTILNLVFNLLYFVLAILLEVLNFKRQRSTLSLMIFTSCMATSVCYWGISYYISNAFDAGLSGLPEWWSMAVHTWPVFGILVDLLCHMPSQPDYKAAFIVTLAVVFIYGIFLDVNATNGYYVYAILGNLQRNDRLLLYLIILGIVFVSFAIVCLITFALYRLSKIQNQNTASDAKSGHSDATSSLSQSQHHDASGNQAFFSIGVPWNTFSLNKSSTQSQQNDSTAGKPTKIVLPSEANCNTTTHS